MAYVEVPDTDLDADSPLLATTLLQLNDNVKSNKASEVTGGDAHNHEGGDGALIPSGGLRYAVGDVKIHGNASEQSTTNGSYTKIKESVIARTGELRIKFDLRSSGGAVTAYGKIYVNGIAVGTERTRTNAAEQNFSEDISSLVAGDTLEVWSKQTGGGTAYVNDLDFYNDTPVDITGVL